MELCSGCGAESNRIRSRWTEKGVRLPDQCPQCDPGSFDKFTMPSDQKMWMGYEAHPNEYEKRYDKDGVFYLRKPEYRAEQQDQLSQGASDEMEAQERAIAKKRAERRTRKMDSVELVRALRKAEEVADWITAAASAGTDLS